MEEIIPFNTLHSREYQGHKKKVQPIINPSIEVLIF